MSATPDRRPLAYAPRDRGATWRLLLGLAGGPLCWAGSLMAVYAVAAQSCGHGLPHRDVLLYTITLIALVGVAVSVLASEAARRRLGAAGALTQRARFMANGALIVCALSAALICFDLVPAFFLDACISGHV